MPPVAHREPEYLTHYVSRQAVSIQGKYQANLEAKEKAILRIVREYPFVMAYAQNHFYQWTELILSRIPQNFAMSPVIDGHLSVIDLQHLEQLDDADRCDLQIVIKC